VGRAKRLKRRVQLRRVESSFETPDCEVMSLGAEEFESNLRNWQLQNNGKKEVRL
jgi:hypothetical protein